MAQGSNATYGNDSGFFQDPVRQSYFRIGNSGGILEYSTFGEFITNTVTVNHGFQGRYSSNAGMFYDTSRSSYFRVDLGGVVFEYDTSLDFLTDSNDTSLVQWVFYGDDAGFFMVPDAPPAVPVGSAPLVGLILLGTGVALLRAKRQQPGSGPQPRA